MPSSCCYSPCGSMLCNILLLPLRQISLNWQIFMHAGHVLQYAGHHLGRWMEPQNLHLCLMGDLICSCDCILFCLCTLFLANILSKSFVPLKALGWVIVPLVPQIFLTTPWFSHLLCYHFLLFLSSFITSVVMHYIKFFLVYIQVVGTWYYPWDCDVQIYK